MFRREQGADKPGDEWRGPARVLGIDRSDRSDAGTVWLQHEAGTVAGAAHLLRPPTTSELYAWCIMSPGMMPQLRLSTTQGQTAFHDYRPRPRAEPSPTAPAPAAASAVPKTPSGISPGTPVPFLDARRAPGTPLPAVPPFPGAPPASVPQDSPMASEAEDAPERPGRPVRKGPESVEPARAAAPAP